MAVVVTVVGGAAARCLAGRNGMAMVAEVEESMVTIRGGACVLMALLLCIRKMSRVHASVMPQTTGLPSALLLLLRGTRIHVSRKLLLKVL